MLLANLLHMCYSSGLLDQDKHWCINSQLPKNPHTATASCKLPLTDKFVEQYPSATGATYLCSNRVLLQYLKLQLSFNSDVELCNHCPLILTKVAMTVPRAAEHCTVETIVALRGFCTWDLETKLRKELYLCLDHSRALWSKSFDSLNKINSTKFSK